MTRLESQGAAGDSAARDTTQTATTAHLRRRHQLQHLGSAADSVEGQAAGEGVQRGHASAGRQSLRVGGRVEQRPAAAGAVVGQTDGGYAPLGSGVGWEGIQC